MQSEHDDASVCRVNIGYADRLRFTFLQSDRLWTYTMREFESNDQSGSYNVICTGNVSKILMHRLRVTHCVYMQSYTQEIHGHLL